MRAPVRAAVLATAVAAVALVVAGGLRGPNPRLAQAQGAGLIGSATSYMGSITNVIQTVYSPAVSRSSVLSWAYCYNTNAAVVHLQVFDVGSPVLGTSPPKMSLDLPASGPANFPLEATFLTAIRVAATTTATGSTAPGSPVDCNFGYR